MCSPAPGGCSAPRSPPGPRSPPAAAPWLVGARPHPGVLTGFSPAWHSPARTATLTCVGRKKAPGLRLLCYPPPRQAHSVMSRTKHLSLLAPACLERAQYTAGTARAGWVQCGSPVPPERHDQTCPSPELARIPSTTTGTVKVWAQLQL